ncbi:ACP S-malonyltransferase [Wenzhouxiangella marina]|uniref:Malonyl CoA-acyl carrier protein transacylase n=1 Tax=Wenzhouxiangella marina TaxID=1579979 RepID=A0A0K0XW90_9GAMM|nr:ACP S-malonyltransferase [Wenzhouxiangella marina]AKS41940.1 Malonyl CoA-acyl carrier protein transacylase [Wenzhouxiangella marina]MBB6086293.1 [acyl-carrier-protein] S-malonyltransferase [Wenzhouxiangella marina]
MSDFAFVFPGQGSQSVGMLSDLAARHPEVQATFVEASEALGEDLWTLSQSGPAERLNQTAITQPVMLAGGIATWRVWQSLGGRAPRLLAGHSLGEYAALVAAGSMNFGDAIKVVAERGRLMQAAVPEGQGAMAAILGLDDEVVEALCREVAEGQVVSAANYNSPGQLVIAGEATAVERAMHSAKEAGARRAVILPVSVPSHCALMKPAAEQLAATLAEVEIGPPSIPVLHNVDVQSRMEGASIREALVAQMHSPVRWTATVRALAEAGIDRVAECGPGRVLAGLGRRIERSLNWAALEDPEQITSCAAEWDQSGN